MCKIIKTLWKLLRLSEYETTTFDSPTKISIISASLAPNFEAMSMAQYQLDNALEKGLEVEAQRAGSTTSAIVSEAVSRHLSYLEEERKIDDERDAEVRAGELVSQERMNQFMEDLFAGKDPKNPEPDTFI